MATTSKRYRAQREKVKLEHVYKFEEACDLVVKTASTKFDETVEISIRLGIDATKSEQGVRGSATLPHGLGKKVRVAVFAKGDKAAEAKEAGADIVGAEDLAEQIKAGNMDFDSVIATPDMMMQVGKVGKLLGPRGLMPSPKVGTVTMDVAKMVREVKAGRAEFRSEKAGIVQAPVGKASFGAQKIRENIAAFMQAVNKGKPTTSKGIYLLSGSLSLTMGPGVAFDVSPFMA
jgi:large subunit ribosomal protein L1